MIAHEGLIPYGIIAEQSDVRAHVCPMARRVYVYATTAAQAMPLTRYRRVPVYINGRLTAEGYLVPPDDIPGCQSFALTLSMWRAYPIRADMRPSEKGLLALKLVQAGIAAGLIALPLSQEVVRDLEMQIAGTDLLLRASVRLQVKCDFAGGDRAHGGTGNLFIQVAERNHERSY
jgi:hypothetical protein